MAKFAAKTRVPAQQTRGEIETLLTAKKATAIGVFSGTEQAAIVFEMQGRRIMFRLPLPPNITDQYRRQRWRALLLAIMPLQPSVFDQGERDRPSANGTCRARSEGRDAA